MSWASPQAATGAFILFLFSVCSPYWSWGTYWTVNNGISQATTVSQGPWIAGWSWSSVPYVCSSYYYCYPGYYSYYSISTYPVYWNGVNNAPAACAYNNTAVYQFWSGPGPKGLGLCNNVPGPFVPTTKSPTSPPSATLPPVLTPTTTQAPVASPTDATTAAPVTAAPVSVRVLQANTTSSPSVSASPVTTPPTTAALPSMNIPTEIKVVEAFSIMSCVFVFFAAVLGCMDAASEGSSSPLAISASVCTFLTMVWSLVAWSQWAAWSYIIALQFDANPPGVPVWIDPSTNQMTAVTINMWLGPGFGCQVAGWCLVFITMLIHCASLPQGDDMPAPAPSGVAGATMPPADKVAQV